MVVSHAGFLRDYVTGCEYNNADYRIFDFRERDAAKAEQSYSLRESALTKGKGGRGTSFEKVRTLA